MKVYIARYEDIMYPADNRILGVYMSEESAERDINTAISFNRDTNFPSKHLSNRNYYSIEEHEIYD